MTMLFADDQVLIASSENELQLATYKLNQIIEKYNMKISINKTKVLAFKGKENVRSKIIINDKPIEQVSSFKFLGCSLNLYTEEDIQRKVDKFNYINGTIKRTLGNKVRRETLLKFYKVMSLPVLLYGSETWVLNKRDRMKIQSAEMKFLRNVAGYKRTDRKRNVEIRQELQVKELNFEITEYRNKWLSHLNRMSANRIPFKVHNYKPTGHRNIGRPRTRWKDQFRVT